MRDESAESAYAAALPRIRKRVATTLTKNDKAAQWFYVPPPTVSPTAVQFKVRWSLSEPAPLETAEGIRVLHHQAEPIDQLRAHEVSTSVSFTSDDANDPVSLDSVVLATAETLARRLRLEERSKILEVLANEGRPQPADLRGVRDSVLDLNRARNPPPDGLSVDRLSCRLLGTASLVALAKSNGVVDSAVDVSNALPEGCRGLVFPMVGGPAIERIVDDVTFATRVLDDGHLEVTLVQRFFISRTHRVVNLVRP